MIAKIEERKKAIALRKEGRSLRDIVKVVPVAKSTLSVWLKQVHLSKPQRQRLTQKKREAQLRGALRRRTDRIASTEIIYQEAAKDIGEVSKRELWLMGVMLYWAEGAKQKEHNVASGVRFSNSDPVMIRVFLRWLDEICRIQFDQVRLDVYIHETAKKTKQEIFHHWSKKIGVPIGSFQGLYYKKGNIKTKRKNIGEDYFGLVSLKVYRSTIMNRRITGWVKGIEQYYWGMV
ncbi:MAG: hypothetical protein AAB416_03105 [Patescibacteria group bacterium]